MATHCLSCYYLVDATITITNASTSRRCTFSLAACRSFSEFSLHLNVFLAFFAVNQFVCCCCWHTNCTNRRCNATKLLQFCHLQRQTIKRHFVPSFIHSFIHFFSYFRSHGLHPRRRNAHRTFSLALSPYAACTAAIDVATLLSDS